MLALMLGEFCSPMLKTPSTCYSPDSNSYKGFLLPIGGEGDEPLWRIGRGSRVALQGERTRCHCCAIVGCHCSVLWCHSWVPLQGAIVVVCWEGDDQLCRSGRGAIVGCHCSVLWWGEGVAGRHCSLLWFRGRVTTNFGGVDGGRCWVPLQGAIVVCCGCQIAIAIGVLTSSRGEGDEPLWRIGRGTRAPLQGTEHAVPLLCLGCHAVCYG